MTDLVKITNTGVIVGNVAELAKVSINGGIYLFSPVDDFVGLTMRPSDGNKSTQIRGLGDDNIPHSIIVFKQILPLGAGSPTDSRIEFHTMDDGVRAARLIIDESGNVVGYPGSILAFEKIWALNGNGLTLKDDGNNLGIFIEDGGQVGIGNANPTSALDITGGVRIRGSSANTTFDGFPGQIAIKNNGPNDGYGISFHRPDGKRIGRISSHETLFTIDAGEDNENATFDIDLNGVTRFKIDKDGKVAIGGYDTNLARPIQGQFHVISDSDRTNFIFVESPGIVGPTPVVLIDQDGMNIGVNLGVCGTVQIQSTDGVFYKGAFITLKAGMTQDVSLDVNNSVTFDCSTYQLKVYRALGNKGYEIAFMGMYT